MAFGTETQTVLSNEKTLSSLLTSMRTRTGTGGSAAQSGFASEVEIIRRRGGNPREMLEQITEWRREAQERGLRFTSDAANAKAAGQTQSTDEPGEEQEEGAGRKSMA